MFAHHAFTLDNLGPAKPVHDRPVAGLEPHNLGAIIVHGDMVSPDMGIVRLYMLVGRDIFHLDLHADMIGCRAINHEVILTRIARNLKV